MADVAVPRESADVAVVVPGGLGALYAELLGGATILRGASRGELGVDVLLLKLLPRDSPLVEVVTCAFAVVASENCAADALAALCAEAGGWERALALWRAWRGGEIDAANALKFRATALHESGERSHSDACAVAAGVMRRWPTWSASMDAFDVEVCALRLPGGPTLVGLPLAPSHWRACDKKGFFPRAVARAGFEPLLRRSVCFAMLQLAEVGPGDVVVDPMAGSGSLPVEAARAFGARWVLGGDLTRVATRQAKFARRVCPELEVARWDARRLPLRSAVADAVVTDIPWGNRSRGDPLLLRDALAEARRLLRPGGRAVLLMTRVAAAACARLDSGLEAEATLDVVVGGWPAAIVRLRKGLGDVAGAAAPPAAALDGAALEAAAAAVDDDDDDVPAFAGVARSALTPCCCAVVVGVLYAELSVAEILLSEWPELVPTISAARRAIKHRRVSRASALDTHVVWWREKVAVGERLVFRPHLARHEPYDEPLRVLWEAGDFLCVHKPPGMQVLRGRRSLANALHAMQAARGVVAAAATDDADGGGGGGGADAGAAPEALPWAPAYDGDGRVGGAWLVTKTATAALALLDGEVTVNLSWRAIVRASADDADACAAAASTAGGGAAASAALRVVREGRSVRYRAIAEVELTLPRADTLAWRRALARAGHPVIGDRPHCDGPKACLWVAAARLSAAAADAPPACAAAAAASAVADDEPPPARFAKLFEREEQVCAYAEAGEVTSEYVKVLMAKVLGREPAEGEVLSVPVLRAPA